MLRLILGKAGTGKTAAVMEEIAEAVRRRQGGRLLIIPEQYSHEAERELCAVCGDSLSLYAEALSFTGLARKLQARMGGGADRLLDKGGRLLCMAQALNAVGSRLKVYGPAQRSAELQAALLGALDELKAACVSAEQLEEAAQADGGSFAGKLSDLALILEAYAAAAANGQADPTGRLELLAGQIEAGGLEPGAVVYVDGFIDFTVQEQRVLEALLRAGAELTVCMTVDSMEGRSEIFELSRRSCRRLAEAAEALGQEVRTEVRDPEDEDQLRFFTDRMFSFGGEPYEGPAGQLRLLLAGSVEAECELAAARALELVRDGGCRWRDIAVAVRGFEDYRGALESAFRLYGVPLYAARKSELLSRPAPALISLAYEILGGGWDVDDVTGYLQTGLTPLSRAEADALAGYIYKWQLRGSAWEREWRQHPEGYGFELDQAALARLEELNRLRRLLAGPLLNLARRGREASTAEGQARALAAFLEELELPQRLEERAAELEAQGLEATAQEYRQIWERIVSALEQSARALGDAEMDMETFGRLFIRMLGMYDLGSIPVSLDRVSAGDFDRMRRRRIKHLIVLGCSDARLPQAESEGGVFSGEERQRLLELGIRLAGGESELWREFSLIYNCLSLPSESLTLSLPALGPDGEEQRPALIYNRAADLFGLTPEAADADLARLSAPGPALILAAHSLRGGSPAAAAAAAWFREEEPERFARLETASRQDRGRLSPGAVEKLYGPQLRLSASRIDKFASCRFAYFCRYGLKARPYEPAGFRPPEIGTFMHYVLENVAREAMAAGGFEHVSDEALDEMVRRSVERYVHEELNDFNEKSARFVYLFRRLEGDVRQIVADMAAELRRSDFEPLDFELDFSKEARLQALELGQGEESLALTGVADRIDGWLHDGRLYLRVVDYKTGRKDFSLTDVYYGLGMQMLLYLFALQARGAERYGHEIVPAGVMYVPARSDLTQAERELEGEEAERQRVKAVRRSGFVLDDPALIEAWERGTEKTYIPLRTSRGRTDPETVASAEQIGTLARRVRDTLTHMAGELRRGSIQADPYFRNQQENACRNCEFYDACHFEDGENGESFRLLAAKRPEEVWGEAEGGGSHA